MTANYSVCTSFRQPGRGRRMASGTSLGLHIRRLEDGRPARDLGFHEAIELRCLALVLGRERSAEIDQPGVDARAVQRPVQRADARVDGVPLRATWREDSVTDT